MAKPVQIIIRGTFEDKITAGLKKTVTQVTSVAKSMNSAFSSAFRSIHAGFSSILSFGKSVLDSIWYYAKRIGIAVAGFMAIAIAAANRFDEATDTIRAGTGAQGEALQGLKKDFEAVYKRVPNDVKSVATAIADLNTRLDLSGEALQGMAKRFLDLSRLTGVEIATLVASVTRVFGDWSIATENQAAAMDFLYRTSQATGIGIDKLADQIVKYGAPLRQLGFSFEEAAVLMAKWEKEGVNAELVAGGLRIALGKMAQAGQEPTKMFPELIRQIKEAGSVGEANALALEYFGARAGADMAAAIREGRFEIEDMVTALKANAETITAAGDETLSFSDKLIMLKNRAALAIAPLGDIIIKALEKALPHIEGVIARVADIDWNAAIAGVQGFLVETVKIKNIIADIKSEFNTVLEGMPLGTKTETTRKTKIVYEVDASGVIRAHTEVNLATRQVQKTLADVSWLDAWSYFKDIAAPQVARAMQWIGKEISVGLQYISSGKAKEDWNALTMDVMRMAKAVKPIARDLAEAAVGLALLVKDKPRILGMAGAFSIIGPSIGPAVIAFSALLNILLQFGILKPLLTGVLVTIKAVGAGLGSIAAIIGTTLTAALSGLSSVVSTMFAGIVIAAKVALTVIGSIVTAIASSPLLVIALVVTAIALWIARWNEIKEGVVVGCEIMKEAIRGLTLDAKAYWIDFCNWFGDVWDKTLGAAIDKVKGFFGKAKPQAKSSPSMIENWVAGIDVIRAHFSGAMAAMQSQYAAVSSVVSMGALQPAYAGGGGATGSTASPRFEIPAMSAAPAPRGATTNNYDFSGLTINAQTNDPDKLSDEFIRAVQYKLDRRKRSGWDPV